MIGRLWRVIVRIIGGINLLFTRLDKQCFYAPYSGGPGNAGGNPAALEGKADKVPFVEREGGYVPVPTPYDIAPGTKLHFVKTPAPFVAVEFSGQFLTVDDEFNMFGMFRNDGVVNAVVIGYAKLNEAGDAFEFGEVIYDGGNGGWIGLDEDGNCVVNKRISGDWETLGNFFGINWTWESRWQLVEEEVLGYKNLSEVEGELREEIAALGGNFGSVVYPDSQGMGSMYRNVTIPGVTDYSQLVNKVISIRSTAALVGGGVTVNVNGLGDKKVYYFDGVDSFSMDASISWFLLLNNQIYQVVYNGTAFYLVSQRYTGISATLVSFSVGSWTASSVYEGYGYEQTVWVENVKLNSIPKHYFQLCLDADGGVIAQAAGLLMTGKMKADNLMTFFSKELPTDFIQGSLVIC
ncbi:MAG: hypothetical protein LBK69_05995 [Syntrophomonadaceae bacterium]|jgi:hypothetical protein|nr:hypothetical protein [Syntrophomonadaceae bacterium]